ncbi:hypothetical protein D3C75_979630 [compost metagenome]
MIPVQFVSTVVPFNAGQRCIGFVRVIAVGLLVIVSTALQQPQSLPQEMGLTPFLTEGDHLTGPATQRIIVVLRFKQSLRPVTLRTHQAVICIIAIVLAAGTFLPDRHIPESIILILPFLPAGQPVITIRLAATDIR